MPGLNPSTARTLFAVICFRPHRRALAPFTRQPKPTPPPTSHKPFADLEYPYGIGVFRFRWRIFQTLRNFPRRPPSLCEASSPTPMPRAPFSFLLCQITRRLTISQYYYASGILLDDVPIKQRRARPHSAHSAGIGWCQGTYIFMNFSQ